MRITSLDCYVEAQGQLPVGLACCSYRRLRGRRRAAPRKKSSNLQKLVGDTDQLLDVRYAGIQQFPLVGV